MTKQIIGRGSESGALYILDHAVPRHRSLVVELLHHLRRIDDWIIPLFPC